MKQLISHDELLEYCNYNQKTGVFILKRNGAMIGHYDKNNEKRTMHIAGKKYQEARLAVFYVTGKWPASYVRNTSKTAQYNTKLRYLVYKDGSEFVSGTQLRCEPIGIGDFWGNFFKTIFGGKLWQK